MAPDPLEEFYQIFSQINPGPEILYFIFQVVFIGGGIWAFVLMYRFYLSFQNKDAGELVDALPILAVVPKTSRYHIDGGLDKFTPGEVDIEEGELTDEEIEKLQEIEDSDDLGELQ